MAEQFCDQIVSFMYLDPTFVFKVKKYEREFQRSKRKTSDMVNIWKTFDTFI